MNKSQRTIPVYFIGFWKHYLIQMRPYLFFISGIAGLAGMAAYAEFSFFGGYSILLFIGFFFSYGFGQALTDCYQMDTDSISAPYRPLSKGILSVRSVKNVSIFGLLFVAFILVFNNAYNLIFCVLSIGGLWTYSYFKKRFWLAGPFYNAWIVALLVFMGFLASSGNPISDLPNPNVIKPALLTFFSYTNFVLIGYLKDITADKETGYQTFPVVFGWNRTVRVGDVFVLICSIIYFTNFIDNLPGIIFGILACVYAISGQIFAHVTQDKSEKNAAFPILATVRSFILWHAGIIASFHPELTIFCILFYLAFELIVYFRPMREQI